LSEGGTALVTDDALETFAKHGTVQLKGFSPA
jgi:hypothetical protein